VPAPKDAFLLSPERAGSLGVDNLGKEKPTHMTPAEYLEWWPGWSVLVSGAMLVYFIWQIRDVGFGRAWTINNYNLLFLAAGLLLHWHPKSFLNACEEGIKYTWGIVIQYPLYAGIFGLMVYTDLGQALARLFSSIKSPGLFPLVVYAYSAVLNYFIPSGGSKWIVEASYLIPAGQTLGLSVPTVTMSYAYGDMTTNLIQPFWAIPLLSVAGLRFGDIMGYCVILAAALVLFNLAILLFIPLRM
jgi:short-chain fatty acids transporter